MATAAAPRVGNALGGRHVKRNISNRDLRRIAENCGLPVDRVRLALALDPSVPALEREKVEGCAREMNYAFSVRDRVAMAANASMATVNRAYRDAERHKVRPEVRAVIERAAARLGYVPDPVAQARRRTRNGKGKIVVMCPHVSTIFNPYVAAITAHLADTLDGAGFHATVAPIAVGRALPDLALSGVACAAVVWSGPKIDDQARALAAAGRAAVMIGPYPGIAGVSIGWTRLGEQVARLALERGYDAFHLGHAAALPWYLGLQLEGFARQVLPPGEAMPRLRITLGAGQDPASLGRTLCDRGLPNAARLLELASRCPAAIGWRARASLPWYRRHAERARELLADADALGAGRSSRVALLGLDDFQAMMLRNVLSGCRPGWTLGREIGVAGLHDLEPLLGYDEPVLTTISYDHRQVARELVGVLERRLRGGEVEKVEVPARVISRRSL